MITAAPASEAGALLALLRRAGAASECAVRGESMGRAIPDGAEVRIAFDGGASARAGDVVAIWLAGEALTVHRLVARGQSARARGHVVTLGDGNLFPETPLPEDALLGTVTEVRVAEGDWRPVPALESRSTAAALVRAISTFAIRAGLELHPAIGTAVKGGIVALLTPLVWLRPYPANRRPASARLGGTPLPRA